MEEKKYVLVDGESNEKKVAATNGIETTPDNKSDMTMAMEILLGEEL